MKKGLQTLLLRAALSPAAALAGAFGVVCQGEVARNYEAPSKMDSYL
jgi:hypothetical protein